LHIDKIGSDGERARKQSKRYGSANESVKVHASPNCYTCRERQEDERSHCKREDDLGKEEGEDVVIELRWQRELAIRSHE
jgi:hypothetical protein